MKKFVIPVITAFIIGCVSAAFAQADEQNKMKTNPVQSGNIVIKLFDLFGYAGLESGDLYDGMDGEVKGINDSTLHPIGFYFPLGTEINYFIIDGLAIGGSFHCVIHRSPGGDDSKVALWSVGPSLYYYFNIDNVILPYLTVSFKYSKVDMETEDSDITLQRIPIGAGLTYMAGKYIGLYIEAAYSFDKMTEEGEDPQNGSMAEFKAGVKAFF